MAFRPKPKELTKMNQWNSTARVRGLAGAALRLRAPSATARDDGEIRGGARVADAPGAGALRLRHPGWRRRRLAPLQSWYHQESSADSRRHTGARDARLVLALPREAHRRAEGAEEERRGDWKGEKNWLHLRVVRLNKFICTLRKNLIKSTAISVVHDLTANFAVESKDFLYRSNRNLIQILFCVKYNFV